MAKTILFYGDVVTLRYPIMKLITRLTRSICQPIIRFINRNTTHWNTKIPLAIRQKVLLLTKLQKFSGKQCIRGYVVFNQADKYVQYFPPAWT